MTAYLNCCSDLTHKGLVLGLGSYGLGLPFHLFCKEKGCQNATVNSAIEAVLNYINVKVD